MAGDEAGNGDNVATMTIAGDAQHRKERGPTQRLADAVLTQAFRDLKSAPENADDETAGTFLSAKEFLLGETEDALLARTMFCDALDMDPEYVERMAHAVIGHEGPEVTARHKPSRKNRQRKQQVA